MLKRLLVAVLLLCACAAQAAVYSLPWGPKPQFIDANGAPMSGGSISTFQGGSSTPQVTYTTQVGNVANPTTITLNVRGETPNEVWLTGGLTYKLVLKDSSGATVWTVDSVSGVNDPSATVQDEWKTSGLVPTYVSATSFTFSGDQTVIFHIGRRIKTTNSGGTVYSTVTASTFAVNTTTLTVVNDSGTLDAGLSAVSYALLSRANASLPQFRHGEPTAAATGSVPRTASAKIDEIVVSVKDFGAKGDSSTDDTTAITSALAALPSSGGVVFFPPGTYKTTATITLKQNVALRGAGMTVSTLAPTVAVATDVLDYEPGTLLTSGIEISDLGFSGNATTLRAIHLVNLTAVSIKRIYVDGFSNASAVFVLWNNVQASQLRDSMFLNAKNFGVKLTSTANANFIVGNSFTAAAAGGGLLLDTGVTQTVVMGNNFEGASLGNIGLTANGTIATSIVGNFFEFWTGTAIAANSGTAKNLTIRDNHIHSTDAGSYMVALGGATNDRIVAENNYLALLGNAGTATVGFDFGDSTNIWARSNKSGGSGTGIVRVNGVTQSLPDYMPIVGAPLDVRSGRAVQSPAYAASITVDAANGENVFVSALTGNITINAPSNPLLGQQLVFHLLQDGTGGRTVTWNAIFTHVLWSDAGNTANRNASSTFIYDGASWRQVGGQRVWN